MTQLEFFQNALANSVEILLNTEAHVISHLKWLIEQKRDAIEKMAKGNVFNSDDICRFDSWEQTGIPHNVELKVVAVDSEFRDYDIIEKIYYSVGSVGDYHDDFAFVSNFPESFKKISGYYSVET